MKLLNLFRKKKVVKTGNPVIDFYNRYDEDGRLLKRSRMPEYLITMRYIEKYLKQPNLQESSKEELLQRKARLEGVLNGEIK